MKPKRYFLTTISILCALSVSGCGNLTGGTSPSGNQTQPGVQVVETPRESSSTAESSAESFSLPASSTPIEPSGTAASSKPSETSGAGESSLSEALTRRVPDVVGQTQSSAETVMMNVGFRVNVTTQYSDTVAAGKVISQSPSTGSAKTGSVVNLVVSKGKKPGESSKIETVSKTELYAAYRDKVNELISQYGIPQCNTECYCGTAVVKLIDFDNDGLEELYCAYSEKIFYADKQEIFAYQSGKVVSLYKGSTNNQGTGVEPYLVLLQKDGREYIKADGVSREDSSSCKWIGIKDHKAYQASTLESFSTSGKENSLSLKRYMATDSTDIIGDTKKVLTALGCSTKGILDKESYMQQLIAIDTYIRTEAWKLFSGEVGPLISELDKTRGLVYDFDGDGNLEYWMKAESSTMHNAGTLSVFCTVKNGQVVELMKGGESGGSMGGTAVTLMYREEDDSLYIGMYRHAGGFGGSYQQSTYYTVENSALKQKMEYSMMSQNGMAPECTINGKSATSEEYQAFAKTNHALSIDKAEQVLNYYAPAVPVRERLRLMEMIN